jgi:hypothetical protein
MQTPKNPDFYLTIDFYFFAMQFGIADPRVKLKYVGKMEWLL